MTTQDNNLTNNVFFIRWKWPLQDILDKQRDILLTYFVKAVRQVDRIQKHGGGTVAVRNDNHNERAVAHGPVARRHKACRAFGENQLN